jgi:hypothetical protein
MNSPIFKVAPQVKSSLFQRLFKQQPADNAIIEVNNLLASRDILSIQVSELRAIEDKYGLKLLAEYSLNLQEFYAVMWNYYIKSEEHSSNLLKRVDHLVVLFNLSLEITKPLKDRIGSVWYRKSAAQFVVKRRLLANDRTSLDVFANRLQLDANITARILEEEQLLVVKSYINTLSQKSRCSPDERMEAERMFENFNISTNLRNEINKQLRLFEVYWEAEHLSLKTFEVAPGRLQKSEICYYYADRIKWYETRNGRYGAKELELINEGELYISNKRLVFIGKFKTSQIPFDRIINILKDNQHVTVVKDKGKNPTLKLTMDSELFSIVLKRVKYGQIT